MRIASGFRNGIGNAVIFTSVLQALKYHSGEKTIDLFLDTEWINSGGGKAIYDIFSGLKYVNVKRYPEEFNKDDYDLMFMSVHSVFTAPVYSAFHNTNELDMSKYTAWGASFMSERDFYYLELIREIDYRGPVFRQEMTWDTKFKIPKSDNIKISIANGYQRTRDGIFQRKQYPHWAEVADTLKRMYPKVDFYILGGKEDREWSKDLAKEIGATDFSGELSILQTASVIRQSDIFMGNDSSCYHIADALETKGIVVFGSTLCSKNSPLNNSIIPIRSPLKCASCQSTVFFKMCAEPQNCMDSIDPSIVVAAIRNIIRSN